MNEKNLLRMAFFRSNNAEDYSTVGIRMNSPFFLRCLILCIYGVIIQTQTTPAASESLSAEQLDKFEADIKALRSALPLLKIEVERESEYVNYFGKGSREKPPVGHGSGIFEMIPQGRFKARMNPFCTVWYNGPAKFGAEDIEKAYDGKNIKRLLHASCPINKKPFPRKIGTISEPQNMGEAWWNHEVKDFFGLRYLAPLFELQTVHCRKWSNALGKYLTAEIEDEKYLVLKTYYDASDVKDNPNKKPTEVVKFQMFPKIGLVEYQHDSVGRDGELRSYYRYKVERFDDSIPSPLMLPKESSFSDWQKEEPTGRANDSTEKNKFRFSYTVIPVPDAGKDSLFKLDFPDGYWLEDERFGIAYNVKNDPNGLIESMRKKE